MLHKEIDPHWLITICWNANNSLFPCLKVTISLFCAGCPTSPPQFSGYPNISAGTVRLEWGQSHIEDPLITNPRYALYHMCEGAAVPTLEAVDLQGSSYTINGLPAAMQCTAQVVLYSTHCERNINGSLVDSITFITATEGEAMSLCSQRAAIMM